MFKILIIHYHWVADWQELQQPFTNKNGPPPPRKGENGPNQPAITNGTCRQRQTKKKALTRQLVYVCDYGVAIPALLFL